MNWIFYSTQEQAEKNQNIIFLNRAEIFKDCQNGVELTPQVTQRYAIPMQRLDGLWGFAKPTEWLEGIDEPVVDEIYNPEWFGGEEII